MNSDRPAEVLLVGVFHFAGSSGDAIELIVPDIMDEARQQELEQLTGLLAEFRPTRVAVEVEPRFEELFSGRYQAYLAGKNPLDPTEQQQLGFRLAARTGLSHVELIDHMFETPFGPLFEAMEREDPAAAREFWSTLRTLEQQSSRTLQEGGIPAALAALNDPAALEANHNLYLRFARFGVDGDYAGATLLGAWYARNARIFANIYALCAPGERVIVLIGSGHVPILAQLLRASAGVNLHMYHQFIPV